jgi:hypothetical protein
LVSKWDPPTMVKYYVYGNNWAKTYWTCDGMKTTT